MFFKVTSVKNGEKIVHYYNNITQEIYTEKGIPVYLQQDPRCQPMVDGYNIRPSRLREKKTNKVRHLRIQLGLNCNFHCKYCNQARDRQSVVSVSLPPETATRRLIEKLQKANIQTSRITLWGGEPFVYYKLLKVLVPALRKQFPNCQISTVSNGSLFDMEKAQWCIDNELQLTISHDAFSFNVYRDDENCLDNPDVVSAIKYYMNMCDEKYVENPKSKIGFSINVVVTPENCNILDIDQYFEEKIGRSVRWHFEGIVKCDENNHNVVHKFDKQHRQTLLTHMMIAGTSDPSGPYWSIREKVSRVLGYIINQVDANSLLYNGNQCSGDGWKYRRRGALLSLVGRRNYDICSNQLYGDNRLIEQPWLVEEAQTAVDVAVWFWKYYNCGTYKNNTEKLLKRLNSSNNIDVDVISAESKLHKLQRLIVV